MHANEQEVKGQMGDIHENEMISSLMKRVPNFGSEFHAAHLDDERFEQLRSFP